MKKIYLLPLLAFAVLMPSCEGKKKGATVEATAVVEKKDLVWDNIVSMDRQNMFLNYKKDYRWYESCILLKDFMDEECDGTIAGISNVFQIHEQVGNGYDVHVILMAHTPDTSTVEVKDGFWVEDYPLNEEAIKVSFKEAFAKIMEVNYPKPHSRHCVLRKEVGPNDCNPQYIFGNQSAQLYVDAVTGEVSPYNPVFGEGFKMPLGEWP